MNVGGKHLSVRMVDALADAHPDGIVRAEYKATLVGLRNRGLASRVTPDGDGGYCAALTRKGEAASVEIVRRRI
jgi:hypothetical protein